MGLLDKFNELKDMITGAVDEAKGQAGEMLGDATETPLAEQAGEAVQQAEDAAQGAGEAAQDAGDAAQGAVEDLKDQHGL
ncbi:YtxH domain-containing protein [Glycomyces paridis]|uniref:YtxH domain-containing protein n=1 Tax=Glycomyces paridis TaxID=2126555 RepID=A0A4V4HPQ1_9ACTN|nr:YtxH domain-containing protein [Glycomyces paridis]THV30826.1 YtxH domain-containing protein [Glycomyces paridis]